MSKSICPVSKLVQVKKGKPAELQGTYLHPDLIVPFAQWLSVEIQYIVNKWVQGWLTSGQAPTIAGVQQRLDSRQTLRDDARLTMCNEIKSRLEEIGQYDTKKSGWIFAVVHDGINQAITGETSQTMRARLSKYLGRKVSEDELIRDYFPTQVIWKYLAFCNAIANLINFPIGANNDSLEKEIKVAIEKAAKIILRPDYIPTQINFEEDIYQLASKVLKQLPDK